MSELDTLSTLRQRLTETEACTDAAATAEGHLRTAITRAVQHHPVKQVAEASGWTRQKIYRHIEVPTKPIGPGLREDQWQRRITQLQTFYSSHGRVPRFGEDRSLSRWLSNCRAAARGRAVTSVVVNDERLTQLDDIAPGWRNPRADPA